MTDLAALRAAYDATLYIIRDGKREVQVRANRLNPDLDRLLESHGAAELVCITAWNPRSEKLAEAVNTAATKRLKDMLEEEDLGWLPHEGRSPSGDWVEKGFAVFDLPAADALALAEMFGQYAILWAAFDQPAQVLYTKLSAQG
ncbi:MAG: hypothetical protein RLY86_4018 [Pseudomonadota bacterium]|jgi:hypothetical protein